jgi:hypothetical protein
MPMNKCSRLNLDLIKEEPHFNNTIQDCSNIFYIIDYLDLHYNKLNENTVSLIVLISLIYVIGLVLYTTLAQFLSSSFTYFEIKYKISPIIVSVTFIPFFNGIMDILVLSSLYSVSFDLYFNIEYILTTFFISACIFSALIFYRFSPLVFANKKFMLIKELTFLALVWGVIIVLGYIQQLNFLYFLGVILFYIFYLLFSIFILPKMLSEKHKIQEIVIDDEDIIIGENEEDNNVETINQSKNIPDLTKTLEITKSSIDEEKGKRKCSVDSQKKITNTSVFYQIKFQLWDSKSSFVYNCCLSPFKLMFIFSIPYEKNPLLTIPFLKPIVLFFSILTHIFLKYSMVTDFLISLCGSLLFTLVFTILFTFIDFFRKKEEPFFRLLTIISVICYMNLLTSFLFDNAYYIFFLSNIQKVYFRTVLISLTNLLVDLFSILSISNFDHGVISFLSIFTNQFFVTIIGAAISIYQSNYNFNLFEINKFNTNNMIIILLFIFNFGFVFALAFYGFITDWKLNKYFALFSGPFFVLFIGVMYFI